MEQKIKSISESFSMQPIKFAITEEEARSSLENIFNKALAKPTHDLTMDNCNLCRIEDILTNYHSYFIKEMDKEQ